MALGQKIKVHHGALKYERETEYKVQEITISAKEHTSKNNQHCLSTATRHSGMLTVASRNHATLAQHHHAKPGEATGVKTPARTKSY